MKIILIIIFLILTTAIHLKAQETVIVSKEAAVKCLENSDKVESLRSEITVKDSAILNLKAEIALVRIELANAVGQKTQLEAALIRYNQIIDLLLKSARPKKIGILVF